MYSQRVSFFLVVVSQLGRGRLLVPGENKAGFSLIVYKYILSLVGRGCACTSAVGTLHPPAEASNRTLVENDWVS